jgi:lambda family phage portal protein
VASKALARQSFRVSWLDRLLIGMAPTWGLQRVRSRAAVSTMARHYEAAAAGRRTDGWYRSGADANRALGKSLGALRELSRDLRRNNGWARRGLQVIANNTVGWGITPKAIASTPELAKRATEVWAKWAASPACDFDGRLPFYGLQRLVMSTVAEGGEALVLCEPASSADGLAVPLRVRVLEGDYLDIGKQGQGASGPIQQGVELDAAGRRAAYWIYKSHPGSGVPGSIELERVAADQLIHVYRVDRPGQLRGEPWLSAAIAKLNDFDDYEDAVLMQQKIAACFGAFVKDVDAAGGPLGEEDATDETLEALEPGHVAYLPPGKDVSFATPPPAGDHGSFSTVTLRRIAAAIGVTYEDLTGDYSQVNFSSARMGRIAHWSGVHDWRWHMLIPQLCDGVWSRVMTLAAGLEGWPEVPRADWSPPPPPMLDPDKEAAAFVRQVRSGAMTLYQGIRELGYDPETHLAEIAEGNQRLDELGIVLDVDPRKTTGAGLMQIEQSKTE